MAANTLQAKRYAQAIFEMALERQELDRWQADLRKIVALSQTTELASAMDNPKYSFENKSKLLQSQLKGLSPLAANLANLLISRSKFSLIQDISDEYQDLLDSYRGIEKAEITTAVPLDEKEKLKLEENLKVLTGKKIIMTIRVDPQIVGGVVVRIGGKLIDGSTVSRLNALKNQMANAGG